MVVWMDSHYKSVHPEYVRWYRRFLATVWAIGFAIVFFTTIAYFILDRLDLPLIRYYFGSLLFLAYVVAVIAVYGLRTHRFRQKWRESHPPVPG